MSTNEDHVIIIAPTLKVAAQYETAHSSRLPGIMNLSLITKRQFESGICVRNDYDRIIVLGEINEAMKYMLAPLYDAGCKIEWAP